MYEWICLYTSINSAFLPTHSDIDSYRILSLYLLFNLVPPSTSLWFIIESRNFSPLHTTSLPVASLLSYLTPINTPFPYSCCALCISSSTWNLVCSLSIVSSFVRNKRRSGKRWEYIKKDETKKRILLKWKESRETKAVEHSPPSPCSVHHHRNLMLQDSGKERISLSIVHCSSYYLEGDRQLNARSRFKILFPASFWSSFCASVILLTWYVYSPCTCYPSTKRKRCNFG